MRAYVQICGEAYLCSVARAEFGVVVRGLYIDLANGINTRLNVAAHSVGPGVLADYAVQGYQCCDLTTVDAGSCGEPAARWP